MITFAPADARSGVAGIEWKLDNGAVKTDRHGERRRRRRRTRLAVRVQDNAGNWSGWGTRTITVNLALDTTAPTDTTSSPRNWRTGAVHRDRQPRPTTSTARASTTSNGAVDGNAIQSGPSGSTSPVTADGVHEIETRATDKAGNVSDWSTQTLKIDKVTPGRHDRPADAAGRTRARSR